MNLADVRRSSWESLRSLGLPENPSLPLIDETLCLRSVSEIIDRALALYCVVAVGYGFERKRAMKWLGRESLTGVLSANETILLTGSGSIPGSIRWQAESLFVFAIILGLIPTTDVLVKCPDDLVHQFPDINRDQDCISFRNRVALTENKTAIAICDLLYCAHWAAVSTQTQSLHRHLRIESLTERRRAIEWSLGDDDWDNVSLDT